MAARPNQKSFYVQDDVASKLDEFVKRYPHVRITDVVNAAFRVGIEPSAYYPHDRQH